MTGAPFYRRAFAVVLQGEVDASILTALAGLTAFFAGLVLVVTSPNRSPTWLSWAALIVAAVLMGIWFSVRGLTVWARPYWRRVRRLESLAAVHAPQSQLGAIPHGTRN